MRITIPVGGMHREGERATMEVPGPHLRVNQITAVSNEGTVRFMTYKGSLDAAMFLVFLTKWIAGASRKLFLIADRLQATQDARGSGWVGSAFKAPDRGILPYRPTRRSGAGGIPEQRHEGGSEQGRLTGKQRSLAHADLGVYESSSRRAKACRQLLSSSQSPICGRY